MEKNQFDIQFVGLQPDLELQSKLEVLLEKIQWAAPSDSCMKLTFAKGQDSFISILNIRSEVKDFIVRASHETIDHCLTQLEERVLRQLNIWKSRRFFNLKDYTEEYVNPMNLKEA